MTEKNAPAVYVSELVNTIRNFDWDELQSVTDRLLTASSSGRRIFLIGNGGSAGNSEHLANDFTYGAFKSFGRGLNVHSLSSNSSVITCLANDIGYENIYSHQIMAYAASGDLLVCFSGSGNSQNIVNAIESSKKIGLYSIGIFGYDGGIAAKHVDFLVHIKSFDMQVCEDMQLIIGHYIMKSIYSKVGAHS